MIFGSYPHHFYGTLGKHIIIFPQTGSKACLQFSLQFNAFLNPLCFLLSYLHHFKLRVCDIDQVQPAYLCKLLDL